MSYIERRPVHFLRLAGVEMQSIESLSELPTAERGKFAGSMRVTQAAMREAV